jgi:Domain of unknown function (DUF4263)
MKQLITHAFSPKKCRRDLGEYSKLLKTTPKLSERTDILPFFKARHDFSLLISRYLPDIKVADVLAHEYSIYGDFVADLVVGDSKVKRYLLVEFENGYPDSVFRKKAGKNTPDWSSRFEAAYSQLVDWLWKLEEMRTTNEFERTFGKHAIFQGIIVIGHKMRLSERETDRLRWRMDKTRIDSHAVSCASFDAIEDDFDFSLRNYYRA